MAEVTAAGTRGARLAEASAGALERLLAVYAQVLFSRSVVVGLLLLLATAVAPRAGLMGVLAVVTADVFARVLGLEQRVIASGVYGYNALLLGLGVGQSFAGFGSVIGVTVLAAVASVVVTAALRSLLGAVNLPVLTLPFVGLFALLLGAADGAGATLLFAEPDTVTVARLPYHVGAFLRSLGALFFLPRLDAGALVLAALVVHSRISTMLAVLAFVVVVFAARALGSGHDDSVVFSLEYNGMVAAVALGAVWYVPSWSSVLVGLVATAVSMLVALGVRPALEGLSLPVGILPLNVAVLVTLAALRQRSRDVSPKSIDFEAGTPEENLAYARGVQARFGWMHAVALKLPFRGAWVCTQGVDGPITHQAEWRHAFDFEILDAEGKLFGADGGTLEDHHCYRLPVLAAADGTVVAVESSVADNAIGKQDLEHNWGNYVIVYHAPGLYSVVAHLAPASSKVRPGQAVKCGDLLGLSGSSGRSPRPHLHFQLQGTPKLGAPTLPCAFNDVVVLGDGRQPAIVRSGTPEEGQIVRNAAAEPEVRAYFAFVPGEEWTFRSAGGTERIVCEVDLYGRHRLVSQDEPATLYYEASDEAFAIDDVVGSRASILHVMRAALSREVFDLASGLVVHDTLPARGFRPWALRMLADLVAPFRSKDGVEMTYRMRRDRANLVVVGESVRRGRGGGPLVRTVAELTRGAGPLRLELTVKGVSAVAERVAGSKKANGDANARQAEEER